MYFNAVLDLIWKVKSFNNSAVAVTMRKVNSFVCWLHLGLSECGCSWLG